MKKRCARPRPLTLGVMLLAGVVSSPLGARASEDSGTPPESAKNTRAQLEKTNSGSAQPTDTVRDEVAVLRQEVEQLKAALAEQKTLLENTAQTLQAVIGQRAGSPVPTLGQVASLAPLVPQPPLTRGAETAILTSAPRPQGPDPVSQANESSTQSYVEKVDSLSKSVNTSLAYLAGFRFSGDFRLRFDTSPRTGTNYAGQVHNVRANYRARFNIDKALNDQLSFHFQVGSGTANNPLTYNSDFSGFAARGPIFIGEAWASYHPNSNIDLLGGKLPELFADDSRFLFKEDIRFNGFQENFKIPLGSHPLGITRLEVRAVQPW